MDVTLYKQSGGCYTKAVTCGNYGWYIYPKSTNDCTRIDSTKTSKTKCHYCGKGSTSTKDVFTYLYNVKKYCSNCGYTTTRQTSKYYCSKQCVYDQACVGTTTACAGTVYALNCSKTQQSFTRTITTYRCSTCGTTATFKPKVSYSCSICGGTHGVEASGTASVTHTK